MTIFRIIGFLISLLLAGLGIKYLFKPFKNFIEWIIESLNDHNN